jgi:hypothetical protein
MEKLEERGDTPSPLNGTDETDFDLHQIDSLHLAFPKEAFLLNEDGQQTGFWIRLEAHVTLLPGQDREEAAQGLYQFLSDQVNTMIDLEKAGYEAPPRELEYVDLSEKVEEW